MKTLQDVTTTEELEKFLKVPKIIQLLPKQIGDLTLTEIAQLRLAKIYPADNTVKLVEVLLTRVENSFFQEDGKGA